MTYTDLFGMEGPVDSGVTDVAEHGRVGNVSSGQPFKFVSNIDGALPTAGNNPSIIVDSTDPNAITIEKTIGATTYTKLVSTSGSVVTVGAWT